MKNINWNEHTLESALAVSPRACRVSDGAVSSEAPCGRSGFKTIIREYLREYDPGDDANDGWCEGRVEIHGKRGILDETRFWFRGSKRGELEFRLTVPYGEPLANGYTY